MKTTDKNKSMSVDRLVIPVGVGIATGLAASYMDNKKIDKSAILYSALFIGANFITLMIYDHVTK